MNSDLLSAAIKTANQQKGKDETSIRKAFQILDLADSEIFLLFLDRTGILSRKEMLYFWQSDFCVKHAKGLIEDLRGVERLIAYFSVDDHVNSDFIRTVWQINPRLLYKTARMSSIYDRDKHIASLNFLALTRDSELHILYKELRFLNAMWHRWQNDEIFYKGVLAQYSFSEILVHFTSYYEKWKRSAPQAMNYKMLNADMEVTLLSVLNMMLTAKIDWQNKNTHRQIAEPGIEECRQWLTEALPPINPPEGIYQNKYLPTESVDDHKKLLRETIRFYFDMHQFQHYANMYSGGYADFDTIEEMYAELMTNPLWFEWRRNDIKISQHKHLMHRSVIDRISPDSLPVTTTPPEREVILATALDEENWKFLGLCTDLINRKSSEKISTKDCFCVLRTLSKVLKPPGRNITIGGKENSVLVSRQQYPKQWLDFAEPAYLAVFSESDLEQKLTSLFNWKQEQTKGVMGLLTTDLNDTSGRKVIVEGRPFLKAGGLVFWLSSFYADREWHQLYLSAVQTDKDIRFACPVRHTAENEIAAYFKQAGFCSIAEYEIKLSGGNIIAKPDGLVFKDNTLFVIEYKLAHHDGDVSKAGRQQAKVFDYLAKTQIEITETWLSENWDSKQCIELREALGINCSFPEMVVIPLIVTNHFEHDGLLIDKRIRTITLYELSVILRNNLYDNLHAPFQKMLRLYSGNLPDMKGDEFMMPFEAAHLANNSRSPFVKTDRPNEHKKEDYDLWAGSKTLSVKRFLEIIDKELVWRFMDETYRYGELVEMKLRPFGRQDETILY